MKNLKNETFFKYLNTYYSIDFRILIYLRCSFHKPPLIENQTFIPIGDNGPDTNLFI